MWGNTECCCEDDQDGGGEDGEDSPTHHVLPVGLGSGGGLLGVPDWLQLGDVRPVLGGGFRFQSLFYILNQQLAIRGEKIVL